MRSAAPVRQNHLSKSEDLMLQTATPLRKSAPWPPNISDEHVSCTAPATRHASFQILFNAPCLPSFLEVLQSLHVLPAFDKVHDPLRLPRETNSEPPKVVRTPGDFNILTSKCASRHNDVHFFHIGTSKRGANMWCFVQFHFEMVSPDQPKRKWPHLAKHCLFPEHSLVLHCQVALEKEVFTVICSNQQKRRVPHCRQLLNTSTFEHRVKRGQKADGFT